MGERGAELGFSSISYAVMIDELVAAILGPQLVIWTRDSIPDLAVAAGVVSYGLITFLMTAAPLVMIHTGHAVDHAALGIRGTSWGCLVPAFSRAN